MWSGYWRFCPNLVHKPWFWLNVPEETLSKQELMLTSWEFWKHKNLNGGHPNSVQKLSVLFNWKKCLIWPFCIPPSQAFSPEGVCNMSKRGANTRRDEPKKTMLFVARRSTADLSSHLFAECIYHMKYTNSTLLWGCSTVEGPEVQTRRESVDT